MDSDKDKIEQEDNRPSLTLVKSITRDELVDYFDKYEKKHGELVCPLCKNTNWVIAADSNEVDKPIIITSPIPRSAGMGIWSFPLFCMECGYTVTLNCNYVATKIRR